MPRLSPGGPRDHNRVWVRVTSIATDLADPESPLEIADEDVLVNNAGFGLQGLFTAIDLGEELQMIRVNVRALTDLTGLLLPGVLERRRRVLNVASTAAFNQDRSSRSTTPRSLRAVVLEGARQRDQWLWRHGDDALPRPHGHCVSEARRHERDEAVSERGHGRGDRGSVRL
jgi:hypothetical protein